MGANSRIEWTDHTFNPWRGCTKVSPGCANCYAEKLSKRNPTVLGEWGPGAPRVLGTEDYRESIWRWNRQAERDGVRRRVFILSLGDWLDHEVPISWLFGLLDDVLRTDHLDKLLLTKRPENWRPRLEAVNRYARSEAIERWLEGIAPPGVWVGVSVENQKAADERIPELLRIPAAIRFLSCEPLLGPVRLDACAPYVLGGDESNPGVLNAFSGECYHPRTAMLRPSPAGPKGIHWVIAGGESGPGARPMHPAWARQLRDQCVAASVPFFFKQWGEWLNPTPEDVARLGAEAFRFGTTKSIGVAPRSGRVGAEIRDHESDIAIAYRVGKRAAGRLLDGREWSEFPEVIQA